MELNIFPLYSCLFFRFFLASSWLSLPFLCIRVDGPWLYFESCFKVSYRSSRSRPLPRDRTKMVKRVEEYCHPEPGETLPFSNDMPYMVWAAGSREYLKTILHPCPFPRPHIFSFVWSSTIGTQRDEGLLGGLDPNLHGPAETDPDASGFLDAKFRP